MIEWKDANSVRPEEGKHVWVLLSHWKEIKPGSYQLIRGKCEIAGGEVESDREGKNWCVNTCDDDGKGCHCFYPPSNEYTSEYHSYFDEAFTHWCYDNEINVPKI